MSEGQGGQGGNEGGAGQGQGEGGKGNEGDKGFQPVTYNSQAEMDAAFAARADQAKRAALKGIPDGMTLEQVLEGYNSHKKAEDAKKDALTLEREAREAAEAKVKSYEGQQARAKLAGEVADNFKVNDKPIPASLLTGNTKEELEASAKEIQSFYEGLGPAPRAPGYNPFQGGGGQQGGGDGAPKEDPIRTYFATGSF